MISMKTKYIELCGKRDAIGDMLETMEVKFEVLLVSFGELNEKISREIGTSIDE